MNKPWKVILAFVGVFLAGVICGGALAPRWWPRPDRPVGARPGGGAQGLMPRLEKQLNLTEEQKGKIRPIVERMQVETQQMRRESVREFAAAMERMNTAIAAELTPEQRVKLEELRKKFRERAEHFRREFRERDRTPGSGDEPPRGAPPPTPPLRVACKGPVPREARSGTEGAAGSGDPALKWESSPAKQGRDRGPPRGKCHTLYDTFRGAGQGGGRGELALALGRGRGMVRAARCHAWAGA